MTRFVTRVAQLGACIKRILWSKKFAEFHGGLIRQSLRYTPASPHSDFVVGVGVTIFKKPLSRAHTCLGLALFVTSRRSLVRCLFQERERGPGRDGHYIMLFVRTFQCTKEEAWLDDHLIGTAAAVLFCCDEHLQQQQRRREQQSSLHVVALQTDGWTRDCILITL